MKYIKRGIEPRVKRLIQDFPVIFITGPRQAGKTTMVRRVFDDFVYFNLETPAVLERAKLDPVGFLSSERMILDEVQNAPWLLSYLLEMVDEGNKKVVVTGSQNLLLFEKISQSLAGRAAVVELLPFSFNEVVKWLPTMPEKVILEGFYPKPFLSGSLVAWDWYQGYIRTYLERDVRSVRAVKDLLLFQDFVKMLAGQAGGLLNLSSISNVIGVSVPTLKEWLSVLESSYLVFRLRPYFANIKKRLVKTPKVYFYDTGVLTSLLGIKTATELDSHPLFGQIFENLIVADLVKKSVCEGWREKLYFLRDKTGHEVDVLIDRAGRLEMVEIKASATFSGRFLKGIEYFQRLLPVEKKRVVYRGGDGFVVKGMEVVPWWKLAEGL